MVVPPAALAAGSLITVTTLSDSSPAGNGQCSLREAIVSANANIGNTNSDCNDGQSGEPDQIQFAVVGTITLASNLPAITDGSGLLIEGFGNVVVDGQDSYTPFSIIGGGLELTDMVVQNGFGAFGGAITNGASVIIRNTTIRSSGATYGGGIHNNGSMLIIASTIEGNTAGNAGGGIYTEDSLVLRNVTLAGNHAIDGGALYQSTGESTLSHVTVSRNSSDGAAVVRGGGTLDIFSSIVAGNGDGQTSGATNHESIIREDATGVLDPGGLTDNGGPTKTIRLVGGSNPALSLGAHDSCSAVGFVDQRGFARPSGATATCDAGAVQRDRIAPVTSAANVYLRMGVALDGTSSRARVTFIASDTGMGIDRFSLQRQVNGGSWSSISTTIPPFLLTSRPVAVADRRGCGSRRSRRGAQRDPHQGQVLPLPGPRRRRGRQRVRVEVHADGHREAVPADKLLDELHLGLVDRELLEVLRRFCALRAGQRQGGGAHLHRSLGRVRDDAACGRDGQGQGLRGRQPHWDPDTRALP